MNPKLTTLYDNVFLLTFDNHYDLAMSFLRCQEYYESPNPDFKGKFFTLLDYMEWYAKERDNTFSYPADWGGFNLPHWVLKDMWRSGRLIPDKNKYDDLMAMFYKQVDAKVPINKKWYMLGCIEEDEETLDHELAHAFYYTDDAYKTKQDKLISKNPKTVEAVKEWLIEEGYADDVMNDEVQAYLSTGLMDETKKQMKKRRIPFKNAAKAFAKNFKQWKAQK